MTVKCRLSSGHTAGGGKASRGAGQSHTGFAGDSQRKWGNAFSSALVAFFKEDSNLSSRDAWGFGVDKKIPYSFSEEKGLEK